MDFFAQSLTQDTLRNFPGPIMAIFDICPFLMAPGLFEYFSENRCLKKIKDILITVHLDLIFGFGIRWADDGATRWANFWGL